jgi:hypothetical protein
LNVIELSATAAGTSSRRTSEAKSACWAGVENAVVIPCPSPKPMTSAAVASSSSVRSASVAERTAAAGCVTRRSRRRSKRSAALPVQGARRSVGANWAKLRTPRRSSEPVSRKTRIAPARFWNHVPLADSALPTKYGANSRETMRRTAARGPTGRRTARCSASGSAMRGPPCAVRRRSGGPSSRVRPARPRAPRRWRPAGARASRSGE